MDGTPCGQAYAIACAHSTGQGASTSEMTIERKKAEEKAFPYHKCLISPVFLPYHAYWDESYTFCPCLSILQQG